MLMDEPCLPEELAQKQYLAISVMSQISSEIKRRLNCSSSKINYRKNACIKHI